MSEKFRIAIIASGRIAREHGRGWKECDRTEIVAIPVERPGIWDERSFLVRGESVSWIE